MLITLLKEMMKTKEKVIKTNYAKKTKWKQKR